MDENPRFRLMTRVLIRSLRAVHPDAQVLVLDSGEARGAASLASEGCEVTRGRPGFDEVLGTVRSSAAYFRLDIPDLFPDDYVLYLDVDMVVRAPLDEVLAARPDYTCMVDEGTRPWARSRALLRYLAGKQHLAYELEGVKHYVPLSRQSKTFNTGLMVLHAARWRAEGIGGRVRRLMEDNRAAVEVTTSDQTAINAFFGHFPHPTDPAECARIERALGPLKRGLGAHLRGALGLLAAPKSVIDELPQRYNATPCVQGLDDAAVVHFRGPKPWQRGAERWAGMTGEEFLAARDMWLAYLEPSERAEFDAWEAEAARAA